MSSRVPGILCAWVVVSIAASPLAAKVGSFWTDLPPLLTPRQEVGVAADLRHIYVIGGILADRSATGIVERLSADTKEWESVTPLPEDARLHHVGAASSLGTIFVLGGLNSGFRGVKSVFAFNPGTGRWERKADMARARGAMGIAAIDDKIYAAGGQDGSSTFDDFAVYHVLDDRWEDLPAMPTARNHLGAASLDGIVYAVGGRSSRLIDKLEAYDPASKGWVELPPLPTARGGIAVAALQGCIFVFGGEGNDDDPSGVFPQVEGYDSCRNTWMRDLDMPHPRHGIGAAVVDIFIHIPGGSTVEGFGVTDASDAYYPGSGPSGFFRGDSNLDAVIDISDALYTLNALFLQAAPLDCPDAADTDDNGAINITDPVFLLTFLFQGGRAPPPPSLPFPGQDPTEDDLFPCVRTPTPRCFEPFPE